MSIKSIAAYHPQNNFWHFAEAMPSNNDTELQKKKKKINFKSIYVYITKLVDKYFW